MNILVTGGAGFIGSHLVDALIERRHFVRIIDNLETQVHRGDIPAYLNPKAEFIHANICDYNQSVYALRDIDIVFHEAALVGVAQSMEQPYRYAHNTLDTAMFLQAIITSDNKPRKMIVASSMSIYGECSGSCPVVESHPIKPASIYAITKRDHEEMFLAIGRAYDIPVIALRYFNTYGPRQSLNNPYTGVVAIFANRIMRGESPIVYEDGKQQRDFVHVSDVVQANLLAMECGRMDYQSFNIGTGQPIEIIQVADELIKASGKNIKPIITNTYRKGDIRHCYPDISEIQGFGYSPKINIRDGLHDYMKALL